MPELGPEPFRGVDPAAFGDVLRTKFGRELGDLRRLAPARVILPQPALRVEVVLPLWLRRESLIARVDRDRARSGRIDADPDNLRGVEIRLALRFSERAPDALLEAEEIIAGMLTRQQAVLRVEQNPLRARRIIDHPAAVFRSVRTADDERAHRVGAEIDP